MHTSFPPPANTPAKTMAIVHLFRNMKENERLSFDEASKAVGFPVFSTSSFYHSAKRFALRDHGVVIDAVRGFGFIRLDGGAIVDSADREFRGIRKRALVAVSNLKKAISGF